MQTKKASWFPWIVPLVALTGACSGGGGGSGSGSFFVETCSLGCSNGASGTQINCGVVNTYENQDVALLFSTPVSLASVNKQSFQIFDVTTGSVPPGSFLLDPANPNRLIFRPKLSFDSNGQPVFGFKTGGAYQIKLNGTIQKDSPPYVESAGGRPNQTRVLCTITTDQGIVDPKPGNPSVTVFVDTLSGTHKPASGALDVLTSSLVTLEFDELMNVGTATDPSNIQFFTNDPVSGLSQFFGTFAYSINQTAQKTIVVFTPSNGLPSGGDALSPTTVLIKIPAAVSDIAGNGLGNAGDVEFTPQILTYPPSTVSEDFESTVQREPTHSGADWGAADPSSTTGNKMLAAGLGGGSGRLGDLVMTTGTKTLLTSPKPASGTITFTGAPVNNDAVEINGVTFKFKKNPAASDEVDLKCTKNQKCPTAACLCMNGLDVPWTVATLVDALNLSTDPLVNEATYVLIGDRTILVNHNTNGTAGNAFTIKFVPFGGAVAAVTSGPTLTGGSDGVTFSTPDELSAVLTNFDFDANPPGSFPPAFTVDDGVFEFGRIDLKSGSTVTVTGNNPGRLLVRGDFTLADGAVIDASGVDNDGTNAIKNAPYGQQGSAGGPNGGRGGKGGDRASYLAGNTLLDAGAVTLASSSTRGANGQGVGQSVQTVPPGKGNGIGGIQWPRIFPSSTTSFGDLAVDATTCTSHQVAGPGSGGAYSENGDAGVPKSDAATGANSAGGTSSNVPVGGGGAIQNTPGGDSAAVGLEPPTTPPDQLTKRLLQPTDVNLQGGAGGGGGGASLWSVTNLQLALDCFTGGAVVNDFFDASGAGGGGGGGALQIQAGNNARVDGVLDVSGGAGGRGSTGTEVFSASAPGGGGSGGALLVQAANVSVQSKAGRMLLDGGNGGKTCVPANLATTCSQAGNGGRGLVRIEGANLSGPTDTLLDSFAPTLVPSALTQSAAAAWFTGDTWSYDPALVTPSNPTLPAVEAVSGAQSCWLQPNVAGGYFSMDFDEDDPLSTTQPFGWNMDVLLEFVPGTITKVAYRGPDGSGPPALGNDFPESHWGQLLRSATPGLSQAASAPIIVRFQGARSSDPNFDPCGANPYDGNSGIQVSSLTPWVRHPAQLNNYPSKSNIVRYVILFDRSHPDFPFVRGVDDVLIHVQPK